MLFAIAASVHSQPVPHPNVQKILHEKGITYEEWLLYEGIKFRRRDYVAAALEKGADPNTARNWHSNQPPLFVAVAGGRDPEIVRLLIQKGANVNARWTPETTDYDRPDLTPMQRFVFRQALKESNSEYFPLYEAVLWSKSVAVVEMLLDAGADVNARTGNLGFTALFPTHDIEVAEALVRRGADVNARNARGETVLKHARRWFALNREPDHWMRPKVEAYCNWLVAQGAKE
jgi:ankyrin repeat protein